MSISYGRPTAESRTIRTDSIGLDLVARELDNEYFKGTVYKAYIPVEEVFNKIPTEDRDKFLGGKGFKELLDERFDVDYNTTDMEDYEPYLGRFILHPKKLISLNLMVKYLGYLPNDKEDIDENRVLVDVNTYTNLEVDNVIFLKNEGDFKYDAASLSKSKAIFTEKAEDIIEQGDKYQFDSKRNRLAIMLDSISQPFMMLSIAKHNGERYDPNMVELTIIPVNMGVELKHVVVNFYMNIFRKYVENVNYQEIEPAESAEIENKAD